MSVSELRGTGGVLGSGRVREGREKGEVREASYQIACLVRGAEEIRELAEFLADFVKDGELENPLSGDDDPATWLQRMEWWWETNPFCGEGSPLGFTLRTGEGELVGFHGLIPYDYEAGGEPIPGLISSVFYVRAEHRPAAIGLFMRVHRLTERYHVVDGGPREKVAKILERFGYGRGGTRKYYVYFPALRLGRRPLKDGLRLVADPSEVGSTPEVKGGEMRPRVTRESLAWTVKAGSARRQFFGVCDAGGCLVAFALGIYKRVRWGFLRCQIVDYASFDASRCTVSELLEHVAANRMRVPLERKTVALVWGVENGAEHPRKRPAFKRASKVYYCGPRNQASKEKAVLPVEGDNTFF